MEKFAQAFVRSGDQSWLCRSAVHFVGAHGPFTCTPGVTYRKGSPINGYDIAQMLDEWYEYHRQPVGIAFL